MLEKPWVIQSVAHERLARVVVYVRGVAWKAQLAMRRTPASEQMQAWEMRRVERKIDVEPRPSQRSLDWGRDLPLTPD